METTINNNVARATIDSSTLPEVEIKMDTNALIIGSLLIVLAIAMFLSPILFENSTMSYGMVFLGIMASCFGIYELGWRLKRAFFVGTNSKIIRNDVFFDLADFAKIKTCLESNDITKLKSMKIQDDGNVMVRIMYSKDKKYTALQLFRYQPFDYYPESDVMQLKGHDSETFLKCIGVK